MVTALADMMVERLKAFQATNNNALPTRILVYRDGVSEVSWEFPSLAQLLYPRFRVNSPLSSPTSSPP